MNILEKLFNGEICPQDNLNLRNNPEYRKYAKEVDRYMKFFEEKLTKEDYTILNDLFEAICLCEGTANSYYFAYGFKLAAMMLREAFGSDGELQGKAR